MSESSGYGRILAELRETRGVLDGHLRPAAQRLVQAEVDQLVDAAREWEARLRYSSAEIDRSLDACQRHWAEMERAYEELTAINEQLSGFGREPVFKREDLLLNSSIVATLIERLNRT